VVQPKRVLTGAAGLALDGAFRASVLARSGLLAPARPDRVVRAGLALSGWSATLAGGVTVAALLHPGDRAIVDERGSLTFAELQRRTNALARALRELGVGPGDGVAVLCRNHGGFVEAAVAASKLGADALFLSTGLAAPQVRAVLDRERPVVVIHDAEFAAAVDHVDAARRLVAWPEDAPAAGGTAIDALIAGGDAADLSPPPRPGRTILLTSGTTGAPKGAARGEPGSLEPVAALLSRIPLRAGETTHIASPLFHSWGYTHLALGIALRSTLVLRRHFDPEATLAALARDRAAVLVVVPTMLERILALGADVHRRHDASALRVVAASGSALRAGLPAEFMDAFGDVLYNLYGSTEVGWVAIATPAELRAAPGTAGRPPRGTRAAIYDERGLAAAPGAVGRIFAGNGIEFEGYTDGGGKEVIDGLLSTGDLGHFDAAGQLFVDGRADDMIVSGGENVYPSEVEDVLVGHPAVADVAVVGVADEQFGQRLVGYVVRAAGAAASADDLKAHVRATLAAFKVPREIRFVDELPRNATGKVLKRVLVADAAEPTVEPTADAAT